jgi:cell wall-associated NlpC family hydrolase
MRLRRFASSFLLFVALSPTLAFAQMRWVTARPVVDMYSGPSTDSDVTSQTIYGVTVVQTQPAPAPKVNIPEGWIYIATPDGYRGWAQRNEFLPLDASETYAGKDKRVVTVANRGANVYREMDVTKHAPLMLLPFEVALEVTGAAANAGEERWLAVKLVDGRDAYIQRGDVQERTSKSFSVPEDIELAKKFLGVTYTWGGTSSFGYDCSGFMQMLMRQRGILMPRDADVQAAWSGLVPVRREELKPGDLLYFGSSEKDITHTGMYIGNGEFIHDTTHGHPMVQISRLADQPWAKLLVARRRAK